MTNKFEVGQKVLCVSQDFPIIKKYGGTGVEATNTPKMGEVLIIDEILGDFIRFEQYDTNESYNWWIHTRFIPIDDIGNTIDRAIDYLYLKPQKIQGNYY